MRPLEGIYDVAFMDAIHFHVCSEEQIIKKTVYIAIGIKMDGVRDVLGMWIGENESAKFWLGILNDLRNRGVEDILIACVDGLTGFTSAIETVYPGQGSRNVSSIRSGTAQSMSRIKILSHS